MNNKKAESSHSIRNYWFMIKFVSKHCPWILPSMIVADLLSTLPWILSNVVLLKYIIDVVTEGKDLFRIAVACIAFASVVVIGNFLNTLFYEIALPLQNNYYPDNYDQKYKEIQENSFAS